MKRKLFFVTFFLLSFFTVKAQYSIIAGANYSTIMNHNILDNTRYRLGCQFGFGYHMHPFIKTPNLSLEAEFLFNSKGYDQLLDKRYFFHFNYLSTPLLLRYAPMKEITVDAGVELSILWFTSVLDGEKNYKDFDTGLVLGLTFFENKKFSLYSRATYGLIPMLDYYSFDKLGNFTGKIHDLRNLNFTLGINYKFYYGKISQY